MSVGKYCQLLHDAKVGKNDKQWFPRWLRRYAATVTSTRSETTQEELTVTESSVICFLQGLRDNGTPAWQRLQAVRAVEMYRNLVLNTDQPALHEIRRTLGRIADRDKVAGGENVSAPNEQQLVGIIDGSVSDCRSHAAIF